MFSAQAAVPAGESSPICASKVARLGDRRIGHQVPNLLYRGGDAVPAEDVGLKLAPYRLGPGVPELALSVDGKVDPLPE